MNLRLEAKGAIKKLRCKGYKISKISPILGSANCTAYKINTLQTDFLLKIYPNEKTYNNQSTRFTREISFLAYLNAAKISNIPELVYKSEKDQAILMSWVKGKEIKSISINSLRAMIDFTAKSNEHSHILEAQRITQAKDSWQGPLAAIDDIENRWKILRTKAPNKRKSDEVQTFLKDKKIKDLVEQEINLLKSKANLPYWHTSSIKQILSQSDMSINNTKKDDREYSFFDFEYSGWDDPAKLATDILCHPDHELDHQDEVQCILLMREKNIFMDNGVEGRIMDSRALARIKWLLIMCNIYVNDRSGAWGMEKINRYSEKIYK